MPKDGSIHQKFRKIKVVMTNGAEFETRSTYGGEVLRLDIDTATHPAWTKEASFLNTRASEVAKFNERYAGLSFGTKKGE